MPAYQKLDLRVAKDWRIGRVVATTYFECWVVPESANVLYPIYNYDYSESQLVVGPPLLPLVGLKLRAE